MAVEDPLARSRKSRGRGGLSASQPAEHGDQEPLGPLADPRLGALPVPRHIEHPYLFGFGPGHHVRGLGQSIDPPDRPASRSRYRPGASSAPPGSPGCQTRSSRPSRRRWPGPARSSRPPAGPHPERLGRLGMRTVLGREVRGHPAAGGDPRRLGRRPAGLVGPGLPTLTTRSSTAQPSSWGRAPWSLT